MIRPALVLLTFFTLLTGVAYPLTFTLFGSDSLRPGAFANVADGPDVFWTRPSAGTPKASSGSNLGPTNPAFLDAVKKRVEQVKAAHPTQAQAVPAELVTTSGSGIDPHLSPLAVKYQVDRVAQARHVPKEKVLQLVDELTEPRFLGIFGEPRVNVVLLNQRLAGL
ncbi:MAG: potassium-transporting ATPase subunit C [Archangium sp.]